MPTLSRVSPILSSSMVPPLSTRSPMSATPPSEISTSFDGASGLTGVCSTPPRVGSMYASASSSASRMLVRPSVGSILRIRSTSSLVLVVNGENTRARSAKAMTITRVRGSAPPKENQPPLVRLSVLTSRTACSLASSRRVWLPSRVFIEAERSMSKTTLSSSLTVVSTIGRARATIPASRMSSCSNNSRFLRSRWKGALTCRSCTARFHSKVEGTSCSRRRSLRK